MHPNSLLNDRRREVEITITDMGHLIMLARRVDDERRVCDKAGSPYPWNREFQQFSMSTFSSTEKSMTHHYVGVYSAAYLALNVNPLPHSTCKRTNP